MLLPSSLQHPSRTATIIGRTLLVFILLFLGWIVIFCNLLEMYCPTCQNTPSLCPDYSPHTP